MELTPLQLNYILDRIVDIGADDHRRNMMLDALQGALQDMPDDRKGIHVHLERNGPTSATLHLNGVELKKVYSVGHSFGVDMIPRVMVEFEADRITGFDT